MFDLYWATIDCLLIHLCLLSALTVVLGHSLSINTVLKLMLIAALLIVWNPIYAVFSAIWPDENPQVSTVICAAILLVVLAFQVIRRQRKPSKKPRAEKIIMTVILSGIITTTLAFHQAFVTGSLYQWRDAINAQNRLLLVLSDEELLTVCKQKELVCAVVTDIDDVPVKGPIAKGLKRIAKDTQQQAQQGYVLFSYAELNDLRSENIGFITYFAEREKKVVLIDQKGAEKAHQAAKSAFYMAGTVAHSFWLLFGFVLIRLHSRERPQYSPDSIQKTS